jgi:hypothetical protein
MIYSPRRKFVFVHIGKCGGSTVSTMYEEKGFLFGDIVLGGTKFAERMNALFNERFQVEKHAAALTIRRVLGQEEWDACATFAFVRHPFDRLVSLYNFLRNNVDKTVAADNARRLDFSSWLRSDFVAHYARRHSLNAMLGDEAGKIIVKNVLRFEKYDEECRRLFKSIGINLVDEVLKKNSSLREVQSADKCSPDDITLVNRLFSKDMDQFGYRTPDGRTNSKFMFSHQATEGRTQALPKLDHELDNALKFLAANQITDCSDGLERLVIQTVLAFSGGQLMVKKFHALWNEIGASLCEAEITRLTVVLKTVGRAKEIDLEQRYITVSAIACALRRESIWLEWLDAALEEAEQTKSLTDLRTFSALLYLHHHRQKQSLGPTVAVTLEPRQQWASVALARGVADNVLGQRREIEPTTGIDRVVFVIGYLVADVERGSHLRQVMTYAVGFASKYSHINVNVVITHEFSTRFFSVGPLRTNQRADDRIREFFADATRRAHVNNLKLYILDPQRSDYFDTISEAIVRFGPTAAVSWYGFYRTEMLAPVLSKLCPTIWIQFSVSNSVDSYATLILSHGSPVDFALKPRGERWRNHHIPLDPPARQLSYPEDRVRKPGDQFVMVSTLGGGRIESAFKQYNRQQRNAIVSMLQEKAGTVWYLIGVSNPSVIAAADRSLSALIDGGIIRTVAFEENLRAFYQYIDLYIHPFGGGGWGAALAIFEGKPMIAITSGDCANFLPKPALFPTMEDCCGEVRRLMHNKQALDALYQSEKKHLDEHHSPNAVSGELLGFINEASEIFFGQVTV